ncbi:metal-dependent hydrolase [Nocardia carnea]|uniref:metal-dependent hydrolase n=1 Tax=Nocardia carnea TaxID=37328 RepID=UPI002456D24A|nr:metal-dependent hydrolase [Nocardia carnea]
MRLFRDDASERVTDPGEVALNARNVHFEWTGIPLHWMKSDPIASHVLNSLNLLLPEGERSFLATFGEALPFVRDEKLRADMLGFIGQESMHAETHAGSHELLLGANGIDPAPYLEQAEYVFRKTIGPRRSTATRAGRQQLVDRLAVIAALEHFFAFLGDWVLNSELEKFDADPRMLDLYRWHGAEEVEHRNVAHDVAEYFGVGYLRRGAVMVLVFPSFLVLLVRGTKFLVHRDPSLPDLGYPRLLGRILRSMWRGALPGVPALLISALSTFKPGYSPESVGSTAQAIAYLAQSPAARAAS